MFLLSGGPEPFSERNPCHHRSKTSAVGGISRMANSIYPTAWREDKRTLMAHFLLHKTYHFVLSLPKKSRELAERLSCSRAPSPAATRRASYSRYSRHRCFGGDRISETNANSARRAIRSDLCSDDARESRSEDQHAMYGMCDCLSDFQPIMYRPLKCSREYRPNQCAVARV